MSLPELKSEIKSRGIAALPVQHGFAPQREQGYLARRRESTFEYGYEKPIKKKEKQRFFRRGLRCILS